MKRASVLLLAGVLSGGCGVLSSSAPASSSSSSSSSSSASSRANYEAMNSMPPAPRSESTPRLADKEVWVPGYYQPMAGAWVWRDGRVMPDKTGYTLVPAAYQEENGKVLFTPPHWRRADLSSRDTK
jgi:hypothetical protein